MPWLPHILTSLLLEHLLHRRLLAHLGSLHRSLYAPSRSPRSFHILAILHVCLGILAFLDVLFGLLVDALEKELLFSAREG